MKQRAWFNPLSDNPVRLVTRRETQRYMRPAVRDTACKHGYVVCGECQQKLAQAVEEENAATLQTQRYRERGNHWWTEWVIEETARRIMERDGITQTEPEHQPTAEPPQPKARVVGGVTWERIQDDHVFYCGAEKHAGEGTKEKNWTRAQWHTESGEDGHRDWLCAPCIDAEEVKAACRDGQARALRDAEAKKESGVDSQLAKSEPDWRAKAREMGWKHEKRTWLCLRCGPGSDMQTGMVWIQPWPGLGYRCDKHARTEVERAGKGEVPGCTHIFDDKTEECVHCGTQRKAWEDSGLASQPEPELPEGWEWISVGQARKLGGRIMKGVDRWAATALVLSEWESHYDFPTARAAAEWVDEQLREGE